MTTQRRSVRKKNVCVVLGLLLFALDSSAEAQQPKKIPRIGVLWGSTPEAEKDRLAAFQDSLWGLGYLVGKNILVEHRYAQ